jgi:hypothetical protein
MTTTEVVEFALGLAWLGLGIVTLAKPEKFLKPNPRRELPRQVRVRRFRWLGGIYLVLGVWA